MLTDKVTLLNQTVLEGFKETDENKIIESFTLVGNKVLGADYGFVWLNSIVSNKLELKFAGPKPPFVPRVPREEGRNSKVIGSDEIDYVIDVKNAPDAEYVGKYIKSFVIIPIGYKENIYGNIVFCFKKKETFTDEKKTLCTFIGNSLAQAITIFRLVQSEYEARSLSEKNEVYFRALIKNSNEIIMLINVRAQIQYVSPSVFRVSGYTTEEMIGEKMQHFFHNEDLPKLEVYLAEVLDNPHTEHIAEFHLMHKNRNLQIMEFTSLNRISHPSIKGIVINVRDITERKNLEIANENKKLLEEERKKIEFIAEANHELRTPIAIIKGNVDLILRESRSHTKRRYADNALRDIDEEVRHITNILSDFSLLTSGKSDTPYKITTRNVSLSMIVSKAVKRWKVIARKKKISIREKTANKVFILGDEKYLDRLIINLIRNAITYGKEKGWVLVELSKNKNSVEIRVKDNGIGISEEDLPFIFDRFYRAQKFHTSKEKNSGLGLAICKWIVESHGGTIYAESKRGKGTTFTISFPVKES